MKDSRVESGEKRMRFSVELPVDDYIKAILLIADGKYLNLKHIILQGLRKIFEEYEEDYFKKLEEENKDLVESILSKAKFVKRKGVRKWVVKE